MQNDGFLFAVTHCDNREYSVGSSDLKTQTAVSAGPNNPDVSQEERCYESGEGGVMRQVVVEDAGCHAQESVSCLNGLLQVRFLWFPFLSGGCRSRYEATNESCLVKRDGKLIS